MLGLRVHAENGFRRPRLVDVENAPKTQLGVSDYKLVFVNAFGILRDELPRHRGEGQRC